MDLILCQQCWLQHSPASINKPYTILLTIDWCPFSLCLNHMPAEISEWPEWKGEAKSLPCRDIDNHFHHSSSLDHPTRGKSMFWGEKKSQIRALPPSFASPPSIGVSCSACISKTMSEYSSTRWSSEGSNLGSSVVPGFEFLAGSSGGVQSSWCIWLTAWARRRG